MAVYISWSVSQDVLYQVIYKDAHFMPPLWQVYPPLPSSSPTFHPRPLAWWNLAARVLKYQNIKALLRGPAVSRALHPTSARSPRYQPPLQRCFRTRTRLALYGNHNKHTNWCVHTCTYSLMYINTHVYIYSRTNAYTYSRTISRTYTFTCVHIDIQIYINIQKYTSIYTCTHFRLYAQ